MKIPRSRGRLVAALCLLAMLMPSTAGCGGSRSAARVVTPVIVDTDMSSDDIMALAYLLERPDVSVRAITVEGTGVADGRAGAVNALRLMRTLGVRRAIPVAYGRSRPLRGSAAFPRAWRNAADQMFNLNLPTWTEAAPSGEAVRLLADTLSRASNPISLITLGPLTDVALALKSSPRIAGNISRIYAMAGAIGVPGNEPTYHRAEWNVYIDPLAASFVLKSGVPVTFVPLEASNNVPITTFVTDAVRSHQQSAGMRLLATLFGDPSYTQAAAYFWDPLTAVAATDGGILRQRQARLRVTQVFGPGYGQTWTGAGGAQVTLGISADAAAFTRDFLTVLNHGRAVTLPAVPKSRRILVSYDGTSYAYASPNAFSAGRLAVRLSNSSGARAGGYYLVVGRLHAGKTFADVAATIRRGHLTAVPKWFQVISVLPAPPGSDATWGVTLTHGRYALVCALDATSALHALTEITVRPL